MTGNNSPMRSREQHSERAVFIIRSIATDLQRDFKFKPPQFYRESPPNDFSFECSSTTGDDGGWIEWSGYVAVGDSDAELDSGVGYFNSVLKKLAHLECDPHDAPLASVFLPIREGGMSLSLRIHEQASQVLLDRLGDNVCRSVRRGIDATRSLEQLLHTLEDREAAKQFLVAGTEDNRRNIIALMLALNCATIERVDEVARSGKYSWQSGTTVGEWLGYGIALLLIWIFGGVSTPDHVLKAKFEQYLVLAKRMIAERSREA